MTIDSKKPATLAMTGLALLLGAAMLLNGIAMLTAPLAWYGRVPGVIQTGPFNQHFIRDIGLIYAMTGIGFALGAAMPRNRLLLWSAATLFLTGHALFHFWEVAVGICSTDALPRDFAGVTLPALIGLSLSGWAAMPRRNAA
ncbi:hypothetical protein [Sphingomonas colocasiae]|uniref:DUF4345 domain-containing protein n=1 Tax=Sphingomonas colocasiae TaxID=1848973 RepID=A0ABS7PN40_9SPHN|nr:hypothetical protein [Sphingomonas colocasiae]MBY8822688.1 hypothetical protein [Sphingomonas colocasiae]